jgi:ribosome-binding protein aMBF1 (putative translation factor)
MSFVWPKPKSMTTDEVVLHRSDWERIVAAFQDSDAEDQADIAAVMAARAEAEKFMTRLEAERGSPVEATIPIEVVKAESDGANPVRAWRDYRGWTQADLSIKSGVRRDLIAQIETRRKKGSIQSLSRLARGLGVPIEVLTEASDE